MPNPYIFVVRIKGTAFYICNFIYVSNGNILPMRTLKQENKRSINFICYFRISFILGSVYIVHPHFINSSVNRRISGAIRFRSFFKTRLYAG